jgi:glutathione S-transferase
VAWQHSGLSNVCSRISFESAFYPFKRKLTPAEVAECDRVFHWLEALLTESRGPFLFGRVTLADFALVPFVIRLTSHAIGLSAWPHVAAWTGEIWRFSLVGEWLDQAKTLPHVWDDSYLVPGMPVDLLPAGALAPGE